MNRRRGSRGDGVRRPHARDERRDDLDSSIVVTPNRRRQRAPWRESLQQHRPCGVLEGTDDAASIECADDAPRQPFVALGLRDLQDDGFGAASAEANDRTRGFAKGVDLYAPVPRVLVETASRVRTAQVAIGHTQ
jgi:hypothetical protein